MWLVVTMSSLSISKVMLLELDPKKGGDIRGRRYAFQNPFVRNYCNFATTY